MYIGDVTRLVVLQQIREPLIRAVPVGFGSLMELHGAACEVACLGEDPSLGFSRRKKRKENKNHAKKIP